MAESGMHFIPTVGLDRDQDHGKEIKGILERGVANEVCLRLGREDLQLPEKTNNEVQKLLELLSLDKSRVHLMVDLRFIDDDTLDHYVDAISTLADALNINDWRSFIVSGSSIPEDVSGLKKDVHNTIRRKEYELWLALVEAELLVGRRPLFSDYTIVHPDKPDAPVTLNKIATKIRYTVDGVWLIWRGSQHESSEARYDDYRDLCESILKHAGYRGKAFSWGDSIVFDCAKGEKRFCGPGKWMEIDINHHLTVVISQLSSSRVSA